MRSLEKRLNLADRIYRIEDAKKHLRREDSGFLIRVHEANSPIWYQEVLFHLFGFYDTRHVVYEATKQVLEERRNVPYIRLNLIRKHLSK